MQLQQKSCDFIIFNKSREKSLFLRSELRSLSNTPHLRSGYSLIQQSKFYRYSRPEKRWLPGQPKLPYHQLGNSPETANALLHFTLAAGRFSYHRNTTDKQKHVDTRHTKDLQKFWKLHNITQTHYFSQSSTTIWGFGTRRPCVRAALLGPKPLWNC